MVSSPDEAILEARDQVIPVYASVERRAVTEDLRIQGEVIGTESVPVPVSLSEGISRAVVTKASVKTGDALKNVALLGTVSDQPLFAITLEIPLYRDLHRGDKGTDVSSLQESLGIPNSGEFDAATIKAVAALYTDEKLTPTGGPAGTYLRLTEFTSIPVSSQQPKVRRISAKGTVIAADQPFAELSLGSSYVKVRASVSEADHISIGDQATIQTAGGSVETGVVREIGGFQDQGTESGRPPGRDIRIELARETKQSPGQSAAVLFGSEPEPVTSVPTLAIRSDTSGEFVLRRVGSEKLERVEVRILRHASGWTAVESKDLSIGQEVRVSS